VIDTDPVEGPVGGKDRGMAVAMRPTLTRPCLGCGQLVDGDAAFCSACGTHQTQYRPIATTGPETERLARSTNAWILAGLVAGALMLAGVGMVTGMVSATTDGLAESDDGEMDAAEAMDAYAPVAETWVDKHDHVTDEAGGDDPNGLATAAEDARLWIGTNRADLGALAAQVDGGSVPLYEELLGIFDQRAAALVTIEATATAGGDPQSAVADEVAVLAALDQQAAAATCDIIDVMRAEGDDPDDHVTGGMGISC
jgi:hypothetical protein